MVHKFKCLVIIMLFFIALPVNLCIAEDLTSQDSITKVAYNHTKILRLPADAATVVLNKANIVSIKMETPRLFMLRALDMGETGLKILDKDYNEILSTTVVVSPEDSRHVNVTRPAENASGFDEVTLNCGSGKCVEVTVEPEEAILETPMP